MNVQDAAIQILKDAGKATSRARPFNRCAAALVRMSRD